MQRHELIHNATHDFVGQLSYDVLGLIFGQLSFRERIRCTRVAKAWRLYLLSWPNLWNDISDSHCNLGTNLIPYLPYFSGKHVRTVRIPEHSDQPIQFLINQRCRYIEILQIPCRPNTLVSVHRMLLFACDSLTDLTIHSGVGDLLLDLVLTRCPNLVSFQYLHSGFYHANNNQHHEKLAQYQGPKLQKLILDVPLSAAKVISILSCSPHLRQLHLRSSAMQYGYFDSILRFIHIFHPHMSHLRLFGARPSSSSSFLSTHIPFPPLDLAKDGLRELWLIGADEGSVQHMLPIIQQHHRTMESLHIRSPITPGVMSCLALHANWPALTELCIQLTHYSPAASDLCNVVRRAPRLSHIQLSSITPTNTISDSVLDAMPASVRSLRLQQGYNLVSGVVTPAGLIRFIQRAARLETLQLPNVQAMTDDVLDALQKHDSTLHTLDVYGNEQISGDGLCRLADSHSQLVWLNLGQCPFVTEHSIRHVRAKLPLAKVYD